MPAAQVRSSTPVSTVAVAEGLRISSIRMTNYRNYENFELGGVGSLTIFTGPNATGKTSAIEAIQMVTALRSFRTSQYHQMIRWGSEAAAVSARFEGDGRQLDVLLSLGEGRRSYQLNGKAKRVQELKGLLPAVCFSPDDLNLVKGPNANRREALDSLGSQLSKNFYSVKSDYSKLVKQRNRALKEGAADEYIDSIDDVLVLVGSQLMAHRLIILERMQPWLRSFYSEISSGGECLDVAYSPSWCDDEACPPPTSSFILDGFDKLAACKSMRDALAAHRAQERARCKTVIGPHVDRITFILDGHDALHYSSQGQQRSIVLAFKLAEAQVIREILGQSPVLLLDDVLSELDEGRRRFFLGFISDDVQTFITTTNAECLGETSSKADFVRLGSKGAACDA